MKKYHVIPLVLFLLVVAGIFGAYQLYFKQQLEEYAANQEKFQALVAQLNRLQETFQGANGQPMEPEQAVEQWRQAIQPWQNAVMSRAQYFHMADWLEYEEVPEEEVPRFYYQEIYDDVRDGFIDELRGSRVRYQASVDFGLPNPDSLRGRDIKRDDIHQWLRRHNLGTSAARHILEYNPRAIYSVNVWPKRTEGSLLEMYTFGYYFEMRLQDLVQLLEDMYTDRERYFNINGVRVTNSNLLSGPNPYLQVEMLMTSSDFLEEKAMQGVRGTGVEEAGETGTGTAGTDTEGSDDIMDMIRQLQGGGAGAGQQAEESWWEAIWPF